MLRHLMTSKNLNIWEVKICLSQERKKLPKWNKKRVFIVPQGHSSRHTKQTSKNVVDTTLKACVCCLFFHQMIALQKLWKMLLISPKKLFSFLRYSKFCISILPSLFFLPVRHCFRGLLLKINLKVYNVINYLNKNLINTFCMISWERKLVWHWNFVHI